MLEELKAKLLSIINEYKQVSVAKNNEFKNAPPSQTPPAAAVSAPAAKTISASVGENGKNNPEDVKLVKTLLNKFGAKLDPNNPAVGPSTIAAIKKFQQEKTGISAPNGSISPSDNTWKALNGAGTTTPANNTTTPPANNTTPSQTISDSVGDKGKNKPEDVKLVKTLLNRFGAKLDPNIPAVGPSTIAAIKKFQQEKAGMSNPDSLISPNGRTWAALNGTGTTNTTNPPNNNPPNNNTTPPPPANGKEQTLGGADDATEQKLQEFMQNMSDIQVQINPGQNPPQIIGVRPPYHINAGKSAEKARAARAGNTKVANIISQIGLGGAAGDGKATPEQMKKFLEECIKQNLIPAGERTSKGMRDFLDKFGVSTDCSGLALQGINFLNDGDMQRDSSDVVGIMNTAMIRDEAAKRNGKFTNVSSPNALKAGDMMNLNNGDVYHVRLLIDVDKMPDGSIEFTTVESTGANISNQGDGVGQRRWKFPNPAKFEGLLIQRNGAFVAASADDRKYPYVRHTSQQ